MQNRRKLFLVCCIFLIVICVGFIVGKIVSQHDREQIYTEMQEDNELLEQEKENAEEDDTIEEVVEIPIDFESLQKRNSDIYAWIQIPETKVDYPIVQHESDDSYYLDHTVEGKKGYPGSIYTELVNGKDFQDANTLIYGHNMKNGSMFGDLSLYKNSTYMKEHSQIVIYTTEHIYTYQVFAAVTYDNRHIMYAFDFSEEEGMEQFLHSLKTVRNMSSYIDKSVEVTSSDRLIILSTCNGNNKQRFLVGAVLVDEQ